ncbi:hypothetical protein [Clostridium psychrophilum]|uniref:hypothetical protein n=1 Tax=Clostridium psychrophilum TaxID=132926 RepID=UPI001C0B1804|nr:hypothetical protein [Clostridium psychrophilum]MBU3180042.1 hypothetical protein [Clostridium psychrophilum]
MNESALKRRFLKISNKFRTGDFNLSTVAVIIDEIRFSLGELTSGEVRLLLEIPINVLKFDVDLNDESNWSKENMDYFASNLCIEDEFVMKLRKKVLNGQSGINDMWSSLEYVKNNYNQLTNKHGRNIELILRNPEITIREDCKIVNEDEFKNNGELFAQYIENAVIL